MDAREKQIVPPRSWETFEELCHALFKADWRDPNAQRNGRRGQPQAGVDVFGTRDGRGSGFLGVQCKGKDQAFHARATVNEFRAELAKAETFAPTLAHWTFATSAPTDAALQEAVRAISTARVAAGQFPVTVMGWQDIQAVIVEHDGVLRQFYPEAAFNVPQLMADLQGLAAGLNTQSPQTADAGARAQQANWRPVAFEAGRDLGPALMGRPLGAADVSACPELPESKIAVEELKRAFSARLEGQPGAGKTVCALQVAAVFAAQGYRVVALDDSRVGRLEWLPDAGGRTLYLVDDAHLTAPGVLDRAEAEASSERLLLSTHNSVALRGDARGVIVIDSKRAVGVIASALRGDRAATLAVVRRIDDRIGDRPHDEDLDHRLDSAEGADHPWQFCFILGGGWRRAAADADAARAAGADLVLAAIALNQLASRDARPAATAIGALASAAGVTPERFDDAIGWLVRRRLVLSADDLRSPHQRFAVVSLARILAGQDRAGRDGVGEMLNRTLEEACHPLLGLRLLLSEWTHLDMNYSWTHLVDRDRLGDLISRCWAAEGAEDRANAMLTLAALRPFLPGGLPTLVKDHEAILAEWFSDPEHPTGLSIGNFTNTVRYDDEDLATRIFCAADPVRVAAAFSAATPETGYHLSEILSSTHSTRTSEWNAAFGAALDWPALIALGRTWTGSDDVFVYARLCGELCGIDQARALDMIEAFLPAARSALARDPVTSFHSLDHITSYALRVLDVLGVWNGKLAPGPRQKRLAARLCEGFEPAVLARQLSNTRKREFQQAAMLLSFLSDAAPKVFDRTVAALDWEALSDTIGGDWADLFHEAEVLLGVCYARRASRAAITTLIERNADRIERLPPRLALMAMDVAYGHVARGREVSLARWDHLNDRLGPFVIEQFAQDRPDLVEALVRPAEPTAIKTLSARDPSWHADKARYFTALREAAPQSLDRILSRIDPAAVETGWILALAKPGSARLTIALMIEWSLDRSDPLGDLARRLRKRFPAKSRPRVREKTPR